MSDRPGLSRRHLLATSAALLATPGAACAAASGPPIAPVRPVSEIYFGKKVTDRYRWMESASPEWQRYVRAEAAYAAKILAKIPNRDTLAAAIGKNTATPTVLALQTAGRRIFTETRPADANTSKLFVRESLNSPDRELLNPDNFAPKGSHAALDWWTPSPDGAHVVFGISPGGSEQSTLHILATETAALLPESITRTPDANPSWLPDGSGFFYNRLQDLPPKSLAYEEKSACWLHFLNTNPASDQKHLAQGLDPAVAVADIDFPNIIATPGSPLALGVLTAGVQNELTLYAAPLANITHGAPAWTKLCGPADQVTGYAVRGEEIFLLTHQHAPRYRVLKTTAATLSIAHAPEAVPQSTAVIRAIAAARDGIYLLSLDGALSTLRRLAPDGNVSQFPLPFPGAINQDSFYADTQHDGVWFLLQAWVHPAVVCHAAPDGTVTQTNIAPIPPIDVTAYTSQEVFVPARDGRKIPLSLVYRKDLKRKDLKRKDLKRKDLPKTPQAPLLLEAYGAYGITLAPVFLARWLPFLDLGGVFAVAHVRGGGELGEDWHRAGQKLEKYHSWQDMIDCAQTLIAQRWTTHKHLAVLGASAGGITVGRLLTERPDLAAVVISEVGVSDALRSEFSPNGPPNIPEFGSVTTEPGFTGLYAMDAYQHVHDGVNYPSVLLTTGLHDPRVAPWEPTKMTARLQAATTSKNPILLRVDADAGHGFGSTRAQRDGETADILAFLLWRTGDPRFQPKT
jgi:prolyl oligopeptidase